MTVPTTAIHGSSSAKWLVFNEVLDVGVTLLLEATSIDPLHLVLIADNVSVNQYVIEVDNSVYLEFESKEEIALVMNMRALWQSFLPALIQRCITPHQSPINKSSLNAAEEALLTFLNTCTNHQRRIKVLN